MTGRTHDLCAVTALNIYVATQPLPHMSLGTALVAFSFGLIAGVIPDLDEWTSDAWDKIPAGSLIGRLIQPIFIGSHRKITHSLLGMAIIAFIARAALQATAHIVLVDMNVVLGAILLGYLSHLIADSLTREGVPWLLPLPFKFGFPPFRFLRIKTASWAEYYLFFPGILLLNAYIIYTHYEQYFTILKSFRK